MSFFSSSNGILLVIFLIISLGIFLYYNFDSINGGVKNIKQNWNDYRCKPYIIPIAGLIGPTGTSTTDNFMDCSNTQITGLFNTLMAPFLNIIDLIINIIRQLVNNINSIREIINYIRESIVTFAEDIYSDMYDVFTRVATLYNDFSKAMYNIFLTFYYVLQGLQNSYYTISSIFSLFNPLLSLFCFDEYTKVRLTDGSIKCIKYIKNGDLLEDYAIVEGVLKLSTKGVDMYEYKGVIVSGEHLIYETSFDSENGKWLKVKESSYAIRLSKDEYQKPFIYSLITSNSKIPVVYNVKYLKNINNLDNINNSNTDTDTNNINKTIFADWYETNDVNIKKEIQNKTLSLLNGDSCDNDSDNSVYNDGNNYKYEDEWWGFNENTILELNDTTTKKIKDIKIGDKLINGSEVLAVVRNIVNSDNLYTLRGRNGLNIVTTGSQIVNYENKWRKVSDNKLINSGISIDNINSDVKDIEMYNLITSNSKIIIGGIEFTDFYQLPTNKTKIIDEYVHSQLNNNY